MKLKIVDAPEQYVVPQAVADVVPKMVDAITAELCGADLPMRLEIGAAADVALLIPEADIWIRNDFEGDAGQVASVCFDEKKADTNGVVLVDTNDGILVIRFDCPEGSRQGSSRVLQIAVCPDRRAAASHLSDVCYRISMELMRQMHAMRDSQRTAARIIGSMLRTAPVD